MNTQNLDRIKQRIQSLKQDSSYDENFAIPELWLNPDGNCGIVEYPPFDFLLNRFEEIEKLSKENIKKAEKHQVVYNLLVRLSSAFDHNGDGIIDVNCPQGCLRETGTFLKTICLLPYIKSLGVNILYLLPVTSIGRFSKKGNLGSPYSIRNPYTLDENLSEPILGFDIECQFAALVEAAHLLGMKVISEFIFRTSSLDNELAAEHPEWFYWIKDEISDRVEGQTEGYGSPIFSPEQIKIIKEKVEKSDFGDLIAPSAEYQSMFTETPIQVLVKSDKIQGITKEGIICRIPSAFADWPPDDIQPPWSDVTYLKLFDHPDFNYISYNTIRMYDKKLNNKKYTQFKLWDYLTGIIPHYHDKFGIDGIMLDMGHALPEVLRKDIVAKARKGHKDFILWEENFTLTKKSKQDGYDAVVGYVPFDQHVHWKLTSLLKMMSENLSPVPFFLSPETHNTPRAAARFGSTRYSEFCIALNTLFTGIFFIHSGFELGETIPVNTGLDFTEEEKSKYPAEILPLFSVSALNWNSDNKLIKLIKKMQEVRILFINLGGRFDAGFKINDQGNEFLVTLTFSSRKSELFFIANIHPSCEMSYEQNLHDGIVTFENPADESKIFLNKGEMIFLKPFEFRIAFHSII